MTNIIASHPLYHERECDKKVERTKLNETLEQWDSLNSEVAKGIAIISIKRMMNHYNITPEELK